MAKSKSNLSPFEKWWENKGYFLAKEKGILGDGTCFNHGDPVEIARLAYETGLYQSPIMISGKDLTVFPSHFIKCSCSGHMLECEVYDYMDGDAGVNFSIWERGREGKKLHTWKERLRWCWHILKTGCLWADDIIATNKEARGLAEFILQNVPKEQPHEENQK
jgi:hypothetical protein